MDVKGAYLNGILQEKVYMRQPTGFDDGTGRVCQLIKTLYGLKQSGREWNMIWDHKLKNNGFTNLKTDPCVYFRRANDVLNIITVWVDDLLVIAKTEESMKDLKQELGTLFEITDLGNPNKIVGIEITTTKNSISICQKQYIMSILQSESMQDANPVSTPLDPNMKLEPIPEGSVGD